MVVDVAVSIITKLCEYPLFFDVLDKTYDVGSEKLKTVIYPILAKVMPVFYGILDKQTVDEMETAIRVSRGTH